MVEGPINRDQKLEALDAETGNMFSTRARSVISAAVFMRLGIRAATL